jgi:hypothetical protein
MLKLGQQMNNYWRMEIFYKIIISKRSQHSRKKIWRWWRLLHWFVKRRLLPIMPSKLQPDRKSKVRWWHRVELGIIWARTRLLKSQNSALRADFRMRVETFWQTLTALSITLNSKKIWLLLECRRISNMTKNHHSLLIHVLSGRHFKKHEIWLVRAHQNLILVTIKLLLHLNVRSLL